MTSSSLSLHFTAPSHTLLPSKPRRSVIVAAQTAHPAESTASPTVDADRLEPRVELRDGFFILKEKFRKGINPQEKVKIESEPMKLFMENGIEELSKKSMEEIDSDKSSKEDVDVRLKWLGLFHRRKHHYGKFMMRLKLPNGVTTSAQTRYLASVIRKYGEDGCADVTTRQNWQIRGVVLPDVPEILKGLASVGLTSLQSGMDNVRNPVGNPIAGIDPDEIVDTRPYTNLLSQFITANSRGNPDFTNLPRKWNVCVVGTHDLYEHPHINDLAYMPANKDGRFGFNVLVGGFFSPKRCEEAIPLDAWVPAEDVLPLCKAVLEAYRDLGTRGNRQKTRMMWLIDELGVEGFRGEVEKRMPSGKLERASSEDLVNKQWERRDYFGVHPQKLEGLSYVGHLGTLSLTTTVKSSKPMVSLSFWIPYFTHWGQSLLVCGSAPGLGSGNVKKGLLLKPSQQEDQLVWSGSVSVPPGFTCDYCYYVVDDLKNVLRSEFGMKRKLVVPEALTGGESVQLRDLWQSGDQALPFRSAFKDVIFRNTGDVEVGKPLGVFENKSDQDDSVVVQFKICCPDVGEGTSVYVLGTSGKLGKWKVESGLKLNYVGDSMWEGDCLIPKAEFPIKYRYCKVPKDGSIGLESGGNRELTLHSFSNKQEYIVMSDGLFREMPWRGAGVAVPMFSVRSEDDVGVGEFLDLKLLVDWSVDSGLHLVQLLPVNDTSVHKMWWDSYPYSSLSVFALHPLYLRVQALSESLPADIKEEIEKAKKQLDKNDVDYEATMETKLSIAKKIFDLEKDQTLSSSSFQKYFSENEGWLKPYAAFCFLRDFFETSDHSQWGTFSDYTEDKLEKLTSKDSLHYNTICFHYYIQYHLHVQLSEASEYARKRGVVLKGDLPIGVDRNSVDTWVNKNLFRMNTSTGAPPDYFDKNGQNWGFPTYNWEEMSKDNYGWWRARLTQMGNYFTAYRIDHILGFFRIWELPAHAMTGLVGKFRPSIPLSQEELEKEGIWDFDRLSKPYVQKKFLEEKFGDFWPFIASNFLNETQKDMYEFKEDCNTEKKIAAKLKSLAAKSLLLENEDKVRRDVFDILRNVVLIKDPEDARKFYPRFNIEDTSSFQDLDDHSKNVLKRLYYDYYFHRQEDLWRKNALKTLPALLNSSNMLACGEDLGLVPACVHPVMKELALVGLRIQRMPSESDVEFGVPSNYDYMTVCAPSCHDCSTLRAWWEEDEERRQRYFKEVIGLDAIPPSQCVPEITHFILRQHVEAPSMWAIFPLQDMLALKEEYTTRPAKEETINDPTNPKHYWRYRVHVTLDSLMKDVDLKSTIKNLVSNSGRSVPASGEDVNNKK